MATRRATRLCNTCGFAGELAHHVDRSSTQAMWDATNNLYYTDEINTAKSILWESYSDILPDTQQHRDAITRAAHEKV